MGNDFNITRQKYLQQKLYIKNAFRFIKVMCMDKNFIPGLRDLEKFISCHS